MTDSLPRDAPQGFSFHRHRSGLIDALGPLYAKGAGTTFEIGLWIDHRHMNGAQTLHAGVISTLADLCIGYGLATAEEPPKPMTTISLTVDISAAAREGAWVVGAADIQHLGSRIGLANCLVKADGATIARASGVYIPGGSSVRRQGPT